MKEVEIEVKTFMVNAMCEECNEGYLIFNGKFRPAIEQRKMVFSHKCTKCGKLTDLKNKYPLTKHKSINADS